MGDVEYPIRRFRIRLAGLLFLHYAVRGLGVPIFLAGGVVLAVRMIGGLSLSSPVIGFAMAAALLTGLIVGLVRMWACLPDIGTLRCVFDKTNHCGGLLMASSETELGHWAQHVGTLELPRLGLDSRRTGLVLLSAVLFLGFGALVPKRYMLPLSGGRLEIDEQAGLIKEQIDILQEEAIVSEETAQDFLDKIDRINETALGRDPIKTWEALGHLQEQLKKAAEQAAVEIAAQTEALTRSEMLAEALAQMAGAMDAKALEGGLSELLKMVQLTAGENDALDKALSDLLSKALAEGQLGPEQLQRLLEALRGEKIKLSESMARLCQAKLIDMSTLKLCEQAGLCNAEGLMALLAECGGGDDAKDAIGLFFSPQGWGINRGPGEAPMIWSGPSTHEDTAFEEQLLPAASPASLDDARLVGVSAVAPEVSQVGEGVAPGALGSAQAGSGQATRQTILPRHRAVVEGYFQRQGTPQTEP